MCCHHQCLLEHIYVSQVNNDNIHQGLEVISGNKNIHLSSGVTKENLGNLSLNMCHSPNNSHNNILKCIMGHCMFTPTRALKQIGT